MFKLPLDREKIFVAWLALQNNICQGKSILPLELKLQPWEEKLKLMASVTAAHPDLESCSKCGQCCLEFPFSCRFVEFLHIINHIAHHWNMAKQKELFLNRIGNLKKDGSICCPFWERQGCLVYEVRPLICRRSICGAHLCNNYSIIFAGPGHRQCHEDVMRQLAAMSVVYFYMEGGRWVEMGWPGALDLGCGAKHCELITAPFEIWLLLLLQMQDACQKTLQSDFYKPVLRYSHGETRWSGVR